MGVVAGVGNVVDLAQIGEDRFEIEWRAHHENAIRVGFSLERDAQLVAHGAASAVCGNDISQAEAALATGGLCRHLDAIALVGDAGHLMLVQERGIRVLAESREQMLGKLVLLALEAVRVARVVLEQGMVEFGDFAFFPTPELRNRTLQAHPDQCFGDAGSLEQIQGCRVES